MERRQFIKSTGLGGFALSMAATAIPLSGWFTNSKPFFKLSLAQWSLHRAILETKALKPLNFAQKAKELGFDAAEYVNQLYAAEMGRYGFDNLITELKRRSADNGVTNVLIMVDNEGELAALSKTGRDAAITNHSRWIDAAAELGCHSIRVNLFGTGAEHDFSIWKQTSADGLGRLAQYAAKSGINVIVENHGGLSSDAGKLIEVIKEVNMPNCGTLPDFGNFCIKREGGEHWGTPCIGEYDKYKGVAELIPFAKGVSAKSYDFDSSGNETAIDYARMLKVVKEAGYTGYIGVEYEGSRLSEEEGIRATRDLLIKTATQL